MVRLTNQNSIFILKSKFKEPNCDSNKEFCMMMKRIGNGQVGLNDEVCSNKYFIYCEGPIYKV